MKAVFLPMRKDDGLLQIAKDHPDIDFAVVFTRDELAREISDADILIANNGPYTPEIAEVVLGKGANLKWIQFSTSGADRAIRNGLPKGIPVTVAAGIKATTIAEHALFMLLALVRRVRDMERLRDQNHWARFELFPKIGSLECGKLVVVGYGAIGQEVARKAKAFDMHVAIVSREGSIGPTVDEAFPRSHLIEALGTADAVVLCVPSTPETRGMIGKAEFAEMRQSAYLVNVARGDLIDEDALIDALQSGQIAGAAIDVARVEPLPLGHTFWRLENLLISPHVAGGGSSGYTRFSRLFSENLRRLQAGEPLLQRIDR